MFILLLGILAGIGVACQTAINGRLRGYLSMPFLTAWVSFAVGTLCLALLSLISGSPIYLEGAAASQVTWWAWLGGLLGIVGVSVNVLLFPKLGSVQTAVIPLLGQVLMGILIDTFGWLNAPQVALNLSRVVGVCLVLLGVFITVVVPNITLLRQQNKANSLWLWRLLGVVGGMAFAAQTAVNGELGRALHSTLQASLFSFAIGMAGLVLIVLLYERSFPQLRHAIGRDKPRWIWLGGSLGAVFIFVSVWLMPQIGTGSTVVLVLFGLILGSLLVDKFGLFGVAKKPVSITQLIGLLFLLAGVITIRLL